MLCDVGWGMRVFKRGQCCVYSDTAEESGIDIYTKLCETVHPLPSSLRVPFQVELVSLRFLSLFHPYLFAIAPPFLRRPFPSCFGCGIPCWRHPTSKPSLQAYRSAHLLHPRTTFWSYIYLFLRSKLPSVSHLSAFLSRSCVSNSSLSAILFEMDSHKQEQISMVTVAWSIQCARASPPKSFSLHRAVKNSTAIQSSQKKVLDF